MYRYDIPYIKSVQEALERREIALLDVHRKFQKKFLDTLKAFSNEASDNHLRGVKPFSVLEESDFFEATISLNRFDLVIASSYDCLLLNKKDDDILASKIFIYDARSEDYQPFAEILIRELNESTYYCDCGWFTSEGRNQITEGGCSEEMGSQVAIALINFFHSFKRSWAESPPTLRTLRARESSTRLIGFPDPKARFQ